MAGLAPALLAQACAAAAPLPAGALPAAVAVAAIVPDPDAPGPLVELDPLTGAERRWTSERGAEPGQLPRDTALPWSALAPDLGLADAPPPDTLRLQRAQLDSDDAPEHLVQALRRGPGGYFELCLLDPGNPTTRLVSQRFAPADDDADDGGDTLEDLALELRAARDLDGDGARDLVLQHQERHRGLGLLENTLLVARWHAPTRDDTMGGDALEILAELELGSRDGGDGTYSELVATAPALVLARHTLYDGAVIDSVLEVVELELEPVRALRRDAAGFVYLERHDTREAAAAAAAALAPELDLETLVVSDPDLRHHLVLAGPLTDATALAARLQRSLPEVSAVADGRLTPYFGALHTNAAARPTRLPAGTRHGGTSIHTLDPEATPRDDDGAGEPAPTVPRRPGEERR